MVGVHNGTLKNWKGQESAKGYDVDSEWAMQMIADHGDDAFQYFDGAYAMVWYDEEHPDHVFMARNDKRPLHFMIDKTSSHIYGASEAGMLGWIAERNEVEMNAAPEKNGIFSLEAGRIYMFDLKNIGEYKSWPTPALDERLLVKDPPSRNLNAFYPYAAWNGYDDEDWGESYHSYGGYSTTTSRTYNDDKQKKMLEGIKAALRKSRYNPTTLPDEDGEVITAEDIERRLHDSLAKRSKVQVINEVLAEGSVSLMSANDSTATRGEIEKAKNAGVFGLVIPFEPVVADNDTGGVPSVCGEFTLEMNGTKQSYVATARMIPGKVAEDVYLRSRDAIPMAIIGMTTTPGGEDEYIIAPLDKKQMEMIECPWEVEDERLVS